MYCKYTANTPLEHFSGKLFLLPGFQDCCSYFFLKKSPPSFLFLSGFFTFFFPPPFAHIPNLPRVEWPAATCHPRQLFPRLKGSVGKPRLPFSPKGAVAVPSDGSAARRLTAQWLEERWRFLGGKNGGRHGHGKFKQGVFFEPQKMGQKIQSLEGESFLLKIPCHFNFRGQ